ncbi:response regulator [Pontiella agarivorans]|uniref:Response regulator n=1 Tax=Pontiella agarivorans TaxID=3038953 RepID=A0ABU5MSU5_9BACT|nr:response regulator [Pontiella agarivorans]MDZ8117276.1 response regulator [Pontiella agarivorans]
MKEIFRILIVDDDASFRSAQKRNVRRMHLRMNVQVEILEAANGSEALEMIKSQSPGCVLLDHNMPGGSGLSCLKNMLDYDPGLAIIMLTGQGSEQLAVDAMKNGAMDYLVKGSISPDELRRAILNAIEKVELRRTIESQREELLDAERQRVMIESLGTACHHIGQPATVINAYLQMMEQQETDGETREMIAACMKASEAMAEILQKLQFVSQYRETPYLPGSEHVGDAIIALD